MANQGYWTTTTQFTLANANAMLVRSGDDSTKGDAGLEGRIFFATDTNKIYRDSGSAWTDLIVSDGGAAEPTMRTLGTGSAQAAAGDHSH